jgi:hypothetical protein
MFASFPLNMSFCWLKSTAAKCAGFAALGVEFPYPPHLSLDLKSIEHGLCEFNKYVG